MPRQAQKPGGDRRANVCAHDDINRLAAAVISPELTKPTTITVVAEELWMTAVTPRPVRRPVNFWEVILLQQGLQAAARRGVSSACPINLHPEQEQTEPAEQR